jgi:CheY-like chemotaxis protein
MASLGRAETARLRGLVPGEYACIEVADTGVGMDARTVERIFEPFFTTKPVNEGTGLGLAVVHGIVESHDGAVTVHTQVGEGTTFNVYVPQPEDTASADVSAAADDGSHHVLLVENDAQTREQAAARLRQMGFAVTACTSAPEALTTVSANTFDVVVTDHVTPNINGLELAEALRHQGHDMPIVLLSGFSAQVSDAALQQAGIEHLLRKPVSLAELESVLETVTD